MDNLFTKKDSLVLKGIAIIFMIFFHLFSSVDRFKNYDVSFFPFNQEFVVDASAYCKICVSIFAFISGYGLLKSLRNIMMEPKNILKWSSSRLIKLMVPFQFIYILSFVICYAIDKRPYTIYCFDKADEYKEVFKGIGYVFSDFFGLANFFDYPTLCTTWWYMTAAILFVLLAPLIYIVSRKIGYLTVLVVVFMIPRILNLGFLSGMNSFLFIPAFTMGMMFAQYDIFKYIDNKLPKGKMKKYFASFIVFGFLVVLSFFIGRSYPNKIAWEFNYTIRAIVFIVFARFCIIRISVIDKILAFFGKHSMTMFLTHSFLRRYYLEEFVYGFGNFIKIFAVLTVLSLLLGLIVDLLIKLVNLDKLINKLIKIVNKRIDNFIEFCKVVCNGI